MDEFVEVTHQGWGSRIMESIKGVLVGIVLFLAAFPVLFLNEGCSVKTYRKLKEGAGVVVSVKAAAVDQSNDGALVHLSAKAVTDGVLQDPELKVKATAIKLHREVEMYQWKEEKRTETKKKLGGGTTKVTKYRYEKVWSSTLNKSSSFKKREGHENPESMPIKGNVEISKMVTAGAFQLSPGLIGQISNKKPLAIEQSDLANFPNHFRKSASLQGNTVYVRTHGGENPEGGSQIGDLRIKFFTTEPAMVSICAKQHGNMLQPYSTKNGALEILHMGEKSAKEIFEAEQDKNRVRTWIVRAVGFVIMLVGLCLVLRPISVLGDVIPLLGNVVGFGLFVVSFLISAGLSLITIAVAWVAYRPLLGIPLLVVGVAALVLVVIRGLKSRKVAAA